MHACHSVIRLDGVVSNLIRTTSCAEIKGSGPPVWIQRYETRLTQSDRMMAMPPWRQNDTTDGYLKRWNALKDGPAVVSPSLALWIYNYCLLAVVGVTGTVVCCTTGAYGLSPLSK